MSDATFSCLRHARALLLLGLLLALLSTLGGCDHLPPAALPASAASAPAVAASAAAPVRDPAPEPADVAQPTRDGCDGRDRAGRRLLQWQDELRSGTGEPLMARINRLGAEPATPAHSIELGLALLHTRNPGDAARAQGLLDGLARATGPEAAAWAPWARLLAGRAAEQRRLEEQADRLNQQQRDSQRRIEQLSEKLEALKAIERSLVPRRPAQAAPGSMR